MSRSDRIRILILTALAGLAASGGAAVAQEGAAVFEQHCVACHQAEGQGVPGAFPPLAGTLPPFLQLEEGRGVLIDILLYGLQGEIQAAGQSYDGTMPAWGDTLSDAEIAAVLNHELTSWGNQEALPETFEPLTEEEVAERRGRDLAAEEVHAQWLELDLE